MNTKRDRIDRMHDDLVQLSMKIGPENAVCELGQSIIARRRPDVMHMAVVQFIRTWGALIDEQREAA